MCSPHTKPRSLLTLPRRPPRGGTSGGGRGGSGCGSCSAGSEDEEQVELVVDDEDDLEPEPESELLEGELGELDLLLGPGCGG